MRKVTLLLLLSLAGLASCGGGGSESRFTTAVFGDVPYGTGPTDTSQFQALPTLMKSINEDPDVSLVLHAGDLHSGKEYCTEAYDRAVFSVLNTISDPMVYTPGDNEWADCHKAAEGGGTWNATSGTVTFVVDANGRQVDYAGGNPVDNLALVRSILFPNPGRSLGGSTMAVHSQAQEFDAAFPADQGYVENTWFMRDGVLFAAVNIPGGSNNGTDPWYGAPAQGAAQAQEVANRTGAAQRWLQKAFDQAAASNASSVVILEQADLWDLDGKPASHIAGYKPYVDIIAARSLVFGKPVLLLNGDSHIYRSDNPLAKGAACVYEPSSGAAAVACTFDAYDNQPNGYNVPNFHRVVIHGSTTPLEWLKLTVDTGLNAAASAQAFGPFSWQRTAVK
ncbi:MAG: hypothetical protein JWQ76_613 [Ramlibacter sp.]|nr:hypothetical protein [Ramlibacter sp.]